MRLTFTVLGVSAFALATAAASSAHAQVRTFKVDGNGGSHIQFVSDATLEKITGVSSKAMGDITVDPEKPADAKADIKVEIKSIKTGVDLRDEHLNKDNWLDSAKYPYSEFVITKVSGVDKLKPNDAVDATVTGKFSLHGVTRDVTTKARVRWVPASAATAQNKVDGDVLRVQTTFVVHLEDYKVSIPSIVSLKVAPDITVNIDLRATAAAAPAAVASAAPATPATAAQPAPEAGGKAHEGHHGATPAEAHHAAAPAKKAEGAAKKPEAKAGKKP